MARRGSNMISRCGNTSDVSRLFEDLGLVPPSPVDSRERVGKCSSTPESKPPHQQRQRSETDSDNVIELGAASRPTHERQPAEQHRGVELEERSGRHGDGDELSTGSVPSDHSSEDSSQEAEMVPRTMGQVISFRVNLQKVLTSSDSGKHSDPNSDLSVKDLHRGGREIGGVDEEVGPTPTHPASHQQGFIHGSQTDLQEFLTSITTSPRDFGRYWTNDILTPSLQDRVMCYRPGKEFQIEDTIHPDSGGCGVFRCFDSHTKRCFVLKRIPTPRHRLAGIEFLAKHCQDFLLKIYGVFKETGTVSIFQEYIEGGTLLDCDWNLEEEVQQLVQQLAVTLLLATEYLHAQDLAHFDIKLMNLMVRDRKDPRSLVIIDFESAKHPQFHFKIPVTGYTLTYLPPWHDMILGLQEYDQVLKTTDMWGIACVIIFFMLPSERHDLKKLEEKGHTHLWSKVTDDIRLKCTVCSQSQNRRKFCDECKKDFLYCLKTRGSEILSIHLERDYDNPNWITLRRMLEYLTDCRQDKIRTKHVTKALRILQGCYSHTPTNETDYDINC